MQFIYRVARAVIDILPAPLLAVYQRNKNARLIRQWERNGRSGPPPHIIKQRIISDAGAAHGCKTLIETGTYLGDMVDAQLKNFDAIISIELSQDLHAKAQQRFARHRHVSIRQGDSGKVLHEIVPSLKNKTLFWLDGHYSAGFTAKGDRDCPIIEELDAILASPLTHVILIDDAHCFTGHGDYPTIREVEAIILAKRPGSTFETKDNIMRATLA